MWCGPVFSVDPKIWQCWLTNMIVNESVTHDQCDTLGTVTFPAIKTIVPWTALIHHPTEAGRWVGLVGSSLSIAFFRLQVSAAADRPARRSASCPSCCTQMSTVSVINWWPRPSPVYHTDRPPKLTAPETISRSTDMIGAHQNLNDSRDHAPFREGLPSLN